ncbi:TetR/AcrR family transcriptional regulator [Saccharicrinis aurantiacus]|uniref:TetR/AcrR family transcriptional regulator n=1 Tax=Saccharicrinis aurantiacus TaxID=1849719 RepID=UPI00248F9B99|nr:TetR/AcrR family transcriptional regulator [Saccharicrinis aurantiacus]
MIDNKKIDKKEAILDAALTLITKFGLHAVSMKMIATEAKVAAGTIYVHFKNKEEMLASLNNILTQKINDIVENNFNEALSFKENFKTLWSIILDAYITDQRIPDFVTQYSFSANNAESDTIQLLAPIYKLLERAQNEGVVKEIPIPALLALAHGPITSLIRMVRRTNLKIKDIDIETYAEACWDGIKK